MRQRGLRTGVAVLACALTAVAAGSAGTEARFTLRGEVARVVDGDTLDVVLASGKRDRVRLVGVDDAERGACYANQAAAQVRRLALSRRVVLKGDGIQPTRDRYGRLLAYVWLPGGKDLGYRLVVSGHAKVYDARFDRLGAYRRAENTARGKRAGRWQACAAPIAPVAAPVEPAQGCHPSYTPCLPVVDDLDCADVRALGKAPVRVVGSDPYRLDGDGDGYGCE
jgi:endonuclease YncB( thermonuclease family)